LPTKSQPVAGCAATYSAAGETMMNGIFFECAIASVVIVATPMSTAPEATAVATAAPYAIDCKSTLTPAFLKNPMSCA
jgi:hypothetical protein